MDVQVKWKVIQNDFPKIIKGLEDKADLAVTKAAHDIEAHAKANAPVDTGTLKNSIQAIRVGKAHWKVIVGVDYGIYVEYGTVHNAAQPYFRPAIQAVRPEFIRALRSLT